MVEGYFTRDGVILINHHKAHLWADGNLSCMRSHAAQRRFSLHAWAGMVGNLLAGSYLLPAPLIFTNFLVILQKLLPSLFDHLPSLFV